MARSRHDEELRRRLIEVASEAIAGAGIEGPSLRSLARAAGTTTAAVYSLFGDRNALMQAVADEGFRRFATFLDDVEAAGQSQQELLELGLAYRDNALANPQFYRVMFSTGASSATGTETFEVLRRAASRATGDGDEAASRDLALRLWALAHGLVSLELAGLLPGTEAERRARYIAALRAYRPLPPGS